MGCGNSKDDDPEKDGRQKRSATAAETEMEKKHREKKLQEQQQHAAKAPPPVAYVTSAVLCIAFDRHEQLVFLGLDRGDVVCRRIASGDVVWRNEAAHSGAATSLDTTHKLEGKSRVVSAGRDGKAIIWDAETGREMFSLSGHVLPVNAVLVSRDDAKIFTASSDKRVIMWDHRTKRETAKLEGHAGIVWALATSYDGKFLFSGSEDKTIIQWLLSGEAATVSKKWTAHDGPVFALLPTRDGDHILSASRDRTLKEWNLRSGEATGTFSNGTEAVTSMALSKDGGKLFVGGSGLTVMDLAVRRGDRIGADGGLANGIITALSISPDNLHLGIGTANGHFIKVDASQFVRPEKLAFHRGTVTSLAISPDGIHVAAASEDTSVTLWNFYSGRLVHRFEGHSSRVWSVAFASSANELFTASEDSTVRIWSVLGGKCLGVLRGHSGCVWAVREAGERQVVSCGDDNTVRLWTCDSDWKALKQHEMRHSSPAVCLAVRQGLAASGSFDNTVKCWSLDTCREVATLEGHTEVIWAVAFTESNSIISGSEDGTVRTWTLTGSPLACFAIGVAVGSLWFSRESSSTGDKQPRIIIGCGNGDLIFAKMPLPASVSDPGVTVKKLAHDASVCSVAMKDDCVISGSVDMAIKYWDAVAPPPPEFHVVFDVV